MGVLKGLPESWGGGWSFPLFLLPGGLGALPAGGTRNKKPPGAARKGAVRRWWEGAEGARQRAGGEDSRSPAAGLLVVRKTLASATVHATCRGEGDPGRVGLREGGPTGGGSATGNGVDRATWLPRRCRAHLQSLADLGKRQTEPQPREKRTCQRRWRTAYARRQWSW